MQQRAKSTPPWKLRDAHSVGTWRSTPRDTESGPMWFEFRLHEDGLFEVTGIPVGTLEREPYRRTGPYRLRGSQLISLAINEGQPVQVRPERDKLVLIIDETLWFKLRRQSPDRHGPHQ